MAGLITELRGLRDNQQNLKRKVAKFVAGSIKLINSEVSKRMKPIRIEEIQSNC